MPKSRAKVPKLKSFNLAEEDVDNLNKLANMRDVSQSEVIRTALRQHFVNSGLTVTVRE
ncbi:CopG family transcriptional regulator [Streptomyces sp. NPDC088847]|uniref:ribbon-helix-helix domain-containing protein n=1 Tax=Streptomyces sp. NPDC088847 TaxID=3365909 RepID=UPI0038276FCE